MATEIERKFLVKDDRYKSLGNYSLFKQGYILNLPEKNIRVRICHNKGFLTIKGKTVGVTRPEYEYEIPLADAKELLANFCDELAIEKNRYIVRYKGFTWEVDEFLGANTGLTIAEIELDSEQMEFPKPEWIGEEVTHDTRYLNANLVKHPYKEW
jgi:adenylate cyclase